MPLQNFCLVYVYLSKVKPLKGRGTHIKEKGVIVLGDPIWQNDRMQILFLLVAGFYSGLLAESCYF